MPTIVLIALLFFLFVATVIAGIFLFLNRHVNDHNIPLLTPNHASNTMQNVLAILAHPDDEVMIAGTLAKLKKAGVQTHLLYLTHGEDGPTGGLAPQAELGALRARELATVGEILQVDTLEILNFPDRYLTQVPATEITIAVQARIEQINPDTIICFDQTVGLYGNSDHIVAGKVAQALAAKLDVKNLLIMTLPQPMIDLALKVSQTFKERYDAENGLPAANGCIKISCFSKQKKAVIAAHQTQKSVMNDVQPLWDKMPAWLYYRIFAKEYFNYRSNASTGGTNERK